ncbi:hypothetical protein Cpir12675_003991 [Ceratocystis pirilliformis]|uniref:Cytidyltransferase-like domain-containing protein n=1 Tax=Ceratocystis pirilliformis TaxID=259994 RepID=A0ABR3Z0J0_9PEZI
MNSLLILPFPPNPLSRVVVEAAYRPPLTSVLTKIAAEIEPSTGVDKAQDQLIIVIPGPFLHGPQYGTKQLVWSSAQSLLAHVYSIIAVVCTRENIAVDASVVLVDHSQGRKFKLEPEWSFRPNGTSIFDLRAFAHSFYPFKNLYRVNTEAGLEVFATYLDLIEGKFLLKQSQIITVEGGLTLNMSQRPEEIQDSDGSTYSVVCIGGTFDHLHVGHKLLLSGGALLLDLSRDTKATFVVGITGDEMLKNKKFADLIEPWSHRARAVMRFLASLLDIRETRGRKATPLDIQEKEDSLSATLRGGSITVECVAIQDGYGPTITHENMDVLVVSGETQSGGKAVNEKRAEKGWHAMQIYEVDVLEATEGEENNAQEGTGDEKGSGSGYAGKISSTAIREHFAQSHRIED